MLSRMQRINKVKGGEEPAGGCSARATYQIISCCRTLTAAPVYARTFQQIIAKHPILRIATVRCIRIFTLSRFMRVCRLSRR